MFKKLFATLAVVGLLATPALAHGPGGHGGVGGGHVVVGGGHFNGGHFGGNHFGGPHFGGSGHFWHGRWWGYGVGPCWRLTPVGYVWVCGDVD